jgi:hypothetical protein
MRWRALDHNIRVQRCQSLFGVAAPNQHDETRRTMMMTRPYLLSVGVVRLDTSWLYILNDTPQCDGK